MKPSEHLVHVGARDDEFEEEGESDRRDERDHERLEQPVALVLEPEHDEHVERR